MSKNTKNTSLNTVVALAIGKGLGKPIIAKASDTVSVGEHHIDTLVRVRGTVTKGKDFEQVVHMKCDQWALIATLFSKVNGVTVDAVVREAMDASEDSVKEFKAKAEAAIHTLKVKKGTATVKGKVTTDLNFEVVETMTEAEKTAVESEAVEA